jgi:signal transduction histidine kinase
VWEDIVLTPQREKIGLIYVRDRFDIIRVRDRVRLVARELGFDNVSQIKITTAVSELTRNICEYARTGTIAISLLEENGRYGMEIICEDKGPGIANLDQVLSGQFRSGSGMGKGLIRSRRLMDAFQIETGPGRGTCIKAVKWFEANQKLLRPLEKIREAFFEPSEVGPVEELQAQNKELVRVLAELVESRRQLEQTNRELRQANEKLKQTDEVKSRFISTIAHEICTPLGAISSLVQVLLRDERNPIAPPHLEIVERLNKSTQILARLVNDLLDLSRLQAGKMQVKLEEFNVAELIGSIYSGLKQTASDKGVKLSYQIEDGLTVAVSDQTKVMQVITNLVSNAIKFTPAGGSVTIKASRPSACEGIEVWQVDVTDTGIGIANEQLHLIFEEFRQLDISNKHHVGGSGLGLPISKRLVELLGGRIEVKSKPGAGSTFTVIWPIDARAHRAYVAPNAHTRNPTLAP